VSFTNEYHWGSFKADPNKLMQRYFDVHVYGANWMTAIFMVRLPIEALTKEVAKTVAVPYLLDVKVSFRNVVHKLHFTFSYLNNPLCFVYFVNNVPCFLL